MESLHMTSYTLPIVKKDLSVIFRKLLASLPYMGIHATLIIVLKPVNS
jgi:hypothetical protein